MLRSPIVELRKSKVSSSPPKYISCGLCVFSCFIRVEEQDWQAEDQDISFNKCIWRCGEGFKEGKLTSLDDQDIYTPLRHQLLIFQISVN